MARTYAVWGSCQKIENAIWDNLVIAWITFQQDKLVIAWSVPDGEPDPQWVRQSMKIVVQVEASEVLAQV